MRSTFAVLALVASLASALPDDIRPRRVSKDQPCRVKPEVQPKLLVKTPLKPVSNLPDQWLWNDVSGSNMVTTVRQQHIPQYCGSCWAQAASSTVSDRIKIARAGLWPEINIAPQVLISCEM